MDPKDASRTVLPGDDHKLWERQNNHVNVILCTLIKTSAGISILDAAGDDASNAFDELKIYHKMSDTASARFVIILDELARLRPKDCLSLGDFVSTFTAKVTEYNNTAPFPLGNEMKRLKLQRCIARNEHLVDAMSTLRIASIAAGKTKQSYTDYMLSPSEACNTIDAAHITKVQNISIPTRQLTDGGVRSL